jgi:predicted hydrocarbon binding protein
MLAGMASPLLDHLAMPRCDGDSMRRCDGAAELELHAADHHARMREILGSIAELDGLGILREHARTAFEAAFAHVLDGVSEPSDRAALAEAYYAYLGLGIVWLDTIDSGELQAPISHVARAWGERASAHACTVTEGFLEAAVAAIAGRIAQVREVCCVAAGAPRCRFAIALGDANDESPRPHAHRHGRIAVTGDVDGLIRNGSDELAHVPVGLYVQALADWLATAAHRGAPVLAHAIARLDHVTAPEPATLRLV